jgi:hypothetical protein
VKKDSISDVLSIYLDEAYSFVGQSEFVFTNLRMEFLCLSSERCNDSSNYSGWN